MRPGLGETDLGSSLGAVEHLEHVRCVLLGSGVWRRREEFHLREPHDAFGDRVWVVEGLYALACAVLTSGVAIL